MNTTAVSGAALLRLCLASALIVLAVECLGEEAVVPAVFTQPLDADSREAFTTVTQRLAQHKVVRADYTQSKRIKVLKKPLVSSGSFLYSADNGVLWTTTEPAPSVLVVTNKGIRQQQDGKWKSVRGSSSAVKFSEMLLAVFSGDTQALGKGFNLYFSHSDEGWSIGLQPKNKRMAKVVDYLLISGEDLVDTFTMVQKNGDSTVSTFSALKTGEALSEDETVLFTDK
jgi:outer membrane lipoprotein-sorting protein